MSWTCLRWLSWPWWAQSAVQPCFFRARKGSLIRMKSDAKSVAKMARTLGRRVLRLVFE